MTIVETAPVRGRVLKTVAGAIVATIGLAGVTSTAAADAVDRTLADLVNERIGLHESELVRLDVDPTPGLEKETAIRLDDQFVTLKVAPHSLRSDDFHVYAYRDGAFHEIDPGPVRTYRGVILGDEGSVVSGGIGEAGMSMRIATGDGREYWVEPIGPHLAGTLDPDMAAAIDGFHVIYRGEDVVDRGDVCGTTSLAGEAGARLDRGDGGGGIASASGADSVAEIAFDVDNRYHFFYGTAGSQARIETTFASITPIYESDVDITYELTTFIIREDPFYNIPATMSTYLTIFSNHWRTQQGGVVRDVAQLFSGWGFPDAAGIAWISGVCTSNGYNIVSNRIALAERVHVGAHELGHNWSADHCTCSGFIMPPSFPPVSSVFHPTLTIPQIVAFRNSRQCLDDPPPPPPPNDNCAGAQPVGDGIVAFDTNGATNDGPALPGSCDEGSGLSFVQDVWFDYTATCTGTATATTCISGTFDTRLAAYAGSSCVGSFLGCNDDACGPGGLQSAMSFPVVNGQHYRVRVGGLTGGGTGILSMECVEGPSCPADIDMSGAIDFGDILAILGAWGDIGGPADVDMSGVVDFGDLLVVLGSWGPCP